MRDITSIGEALIDLTWAGNSPTGVPLYAANPGGAPANVAVAAARLGARTAFLGKVGPDAFGQQMRQVLRSICVDDHGLLTGQSPTTPSFGGQTGSCPPTRWRRRSWRRGKFSTSVQ